MDAADADRELTAARVDILQGRGAEAAERLRATLADGADIDPRPRYWLAAALGAAGERAASIEALRQAETQHALLMIRQAGGELERLRDDPAYAAEVGRLFYAEGKVAVAGVALAQAASGGEPPFQVLLTLGLSLQHQGRMEDAAATFALAERLFPGAGAQSFLLYALFHVSDGVMRHAQSAREWRARKGVAVRSAPCAQPLRGRPLRVGYVLPTLGAQARPFLLPVIEHHDADRVQAVTYLAREEAAPICVRAIGHLDDVRAASLIAEDGVDVLVDVWGHTAGGRLGVFIERPAPVQASWLNYVQTTGVDEIDYLLHPDCMDVAGAQAACVETIWNIGPLMAPFRPDARGEPTRAPCLANGVVTFASYNHPSRLNDETVHAWAAILKRVAGSRLVLRYRYFADEVLANATLIRFAARGVDPQRIVCVGALKQPDYYASFGEIDIALDPSPCPGGTTTLDALANGVPVITLAGDDYYSRSGVAALGPLGLDELIATSWDDYIARAVALASNPARLDALRVRVRDAFDTSGRTDEAGFTRRLEDSFHAMHAQRLSEQARAAA